MAANNNPPIQIHPDVDKNTQVAFINENFRKISDGFSPLRISDGATDRVIIGKYGTEQYGVVGTDTDGTRRILIGSAPDDGRIGIWVSREGIDVIDELSA